MAKNTDNPQTCRECGALIDSEKTRTHSDWHKTMTKELKKAYEGPEGERRKWSGHV